VFNKLLLNVPHPGEKYSLFYIVPSCYPRSREDVDTLAFFFALTLASALAQGPSVPQPDLQSAGALGTDLFLQSGSTGMVLVVVRDDQVFFRGYGETAPNSHQLPTRDSLLRLCSLTKIFTTDVLTKLVADKTLRLDDPLQQYAPPGVVVSKRVRPITLSDMATHTSGLPRELGNAPPDTPHFTFPDYRTRWRWLPNQHLRSTPGSAALYSNVTFDFLSDALQSAAHKQYAALLAERALNPLHMQNTTIFPNPEQCRHLLVSAHEEGSCTATEATAGSSGLYSTADDMAIWLKYLLRTGDSGTPARDASAQAIYVFPSNLVSQKGLDHAGEPTGVGLGWIHILPIDSQSHIIEKTGGGAGFETYIAINHFRHTAIFLAATDGPVDTHLNLFNAANKLLLAVAGLPPLPPPPSKPKGKRAHPHRRR
jgi:D-alanyl-D-alanine-carboxypeptidase/D-alanyl-D-alanine-endopeptidase